ncbi:MAG TPA: carbon-nitrogen hydrolase family protein [Planctomycetaceae bacterium]|nr:carbon-nitrogen hydrolase family protein [Planctomycetaceae bacterium]
MNVSGVRDNLPYLQAKLDYFMYLFPWVQMVVFSELAAYGPNPAKAEPLPGPAERKFQEMAAKHKIWIVNGSLIEMLNGAKYNTLSVIDPTGKVIGRYRKIFPFLPYEEGITSGSSFFVFDIPDVGRFGVSICYDMWFPETSRVLASMGAEVILHPTLTTTIDRDVELSIARTTAAIN